jgi:hypothetical protein
MPAPLVGAAVAAAARLAAKKLGQEAAKKTAKRVVARTKDKLEDSKVANKIANTKPVVKASEAVAKKVQASRNQRLKKSVNTIADSADKARAAQIAKNSVKVRRGNASEAKRLNEFSNKRTTDIATGARAQRESANVKQMKPAKVVKVNSAPAKSADAAKKAADAKALKAANKKKK